jgi:hypothetical protein
MKRNPINANAITLAVFWSFMTYNYGRLLKELSLRLQVQNTQRLELVGVHRQNE